MDCTQTHTHTHESLEVCLVAEDVAARHREVWVGVANDRVPEVSVSGDDFQRKNRTWYTSVTRSIVPEPSSENGFSMTEPSRNAQNPPLRSYGTFVPIARKASTRRIWQSGIACEARMLQAVCIWIVISAMPSHCDPRMQSKPLSLTSAGIGLELAVLADFCGRVATDPRKRSCSFVRHLFDSHATTNTASEVNMGMLPGGSRKHHLDAWRACFPRTKINEIVSTVLLKTDVR